MCKLSNNGLALLGVYISHKASYRREECERYGIDYNAGVAELKATTSLFTGVRMNLKEGRVLFSHLMPSDTIASQLHWYMDDLGFSTN